ncbi:MAG: ABC transporter permease subunit [Gemmatimonadota bacterium]|nr:MAG: ABC transporter permease subunit [Gemmatimonadota bacterium]
MREASSSNGARRRRVLATLLGLELRLLLRDKRTIIIAVLLPLLIYPAFILAMRAVSRAGQERLEAATYEYAITGSEAELARSLVQEALALSAAEDDSAEVPTNFVERVADAPDSLLRAGELQLVVEWMSHEEYRAEREAEAEGDTAALRRLDELAAVPAVRLSFRSNSELSSTAASRMGARLRRLRVERRDRLLRERGLPLDPGELAKLELNNVAPAEKEAGAVLGMILTPLLVLLMLSGGSVVAADAISGEKERGTIETLLTTAARRGEIVAAKQLAIIGVGIAIAVINVANLLVYVVLGVFELPERFAVSVEPVALIVLLLLFLPLTGVISATLLALSGYSKTYREYQIYFFPVLLLFLFPSAAAVLPGIELRSAIVLVPVANISVAVREVLVGTYDWLFLGLTFAVTMAAALYTSRLTSLALSTERLITAAELDRAELIGGPALFPKRVLRWFGIMWVTLFITSLWLGATLGIRLQVVVNILGIFFGGSLLIIWRYRLQPREVLALRPVRLPVWIAVLIGAPSAYLVGVGLARLADLILPVPERMLESFGEYLIAPELALWQVILFLAVIPGIFEEIAFRGVLLSGLRKRLRPVALCLVTGAIFGLFHIDLFRIVPTAFLGAILAAVVLISGSIFPAMLWHALNNAVALVPAYLELRIAEPPLWSFGLGVLGLALAFWILWRYRSRAALAGGDGGG